MSEQELLDRLKEAIKEDLPDEEVTARAAAVINAGIPARRAIDEATKAIREVGNEFECGDKFLPELMIAAQKMDVCLKTLQPHLKAGEESGSHGKVVIGTVAGDIHDLGKNLVATMLSLGGFSVVNIGINVPPFDFITRAEGEKADIIALSGLMTTSMPYQGEVIDLLREMNLREKYFVIVGGGPVTPEYAEEIGADGYAEKAAGAIGLCDKLLGLGTTPPLSKPVTA
jgi:methylmalonyl-CoA mutase cobalamin-binding domain/chain